MEQETKTLGAAIAALRKQQNMTQADLAARMGVTDKAVSKWERDLSCPEVTAFPRLAEALGTTPQELLQAKAPAPHKSEAQGLVKLIGRCVGLAAGGAVVALSALGQISADAALPLLGLGLAALALAALQE